MYLCYITWQSRTGSLVLPEEILDPTSVSSSPAAREPHIERNSWLFPLRRRTTYSQLERKSFFFIFSLEKLNTSAAAVTEVYCVFIV